MRLKLHRKHRNARYRTQRWRTLHMRTTASSQHYKTDDWRGTRLTEKPLPRTCSLEVALRTSSGEIACWFFRFPFVRRRCSSSCSKTGSTQGVGGDFDVPPRQPFTPQINLHSGVLWKRRFSAKAKHRTYPALHRLDDTSNLRSPQMAERATSRVVFANITNYIDKNG